MPKIQIKMSRKEEEGFRSILIAYRKDRAGEKEFEDFINNIIKETFEMSTKIAVLLREN